MEKEILNRVVEKLNELGMFKCTVLGTEIIIGKQMVDARILLENTKKNWKYNVEIKTRILPAQITILKDHMAGLEPYLLIAEYITTKAKKMLRDNNIPYADTAGNIFLKGDGLYVFVETHKTNRLKLKTGSRAFHKAGLKVIFQLLTNPDYLNKPYRFIGDHAKVTIDTVSRVIQELLRDKYILQTQAKKYQFLDRPRLFREWVTAFNRNLRPALKQTRYRFLDRKFDWKKINLPDQTHWGGAVAAEIVTDYLIADKGIIYTDLPFPEIMKKLRLIPDPTGTITVIEKFWKGNGEGVVVHPMLIYADLIHELNPRYMETASKIYKDYVEVQL